MKGRNNRIKRAPRQPSSFNKTTITELFSPRSIRIPNAQNPSQ